MFVSTYLVSVPISVTLITRIIIPIEHIKRHIFHQRSFNRKEWHYGARPFHRVVKVQIGSWEVDSPHVRSFPIRSASSLTTLTSAEDSSSVIDSY